MLCMLLSVYAPVKYGYANQISKYVLYLLPVSSACPDGMGAEFSSDNSSIYEGTPGPYLNLWRKKLCRLSTH